MLLEKSGGGSFAARSGTFLERQRNITNLYSTILVCVYARKFDQDAICLGKGIFLELAELRLAIHLLTHSFHSNSILGKNRWRAG
jgi:hypothetical protein